MNKRGSFPNFFILGVPKSGTTSLHKYLNLHLQIFMSQEKEPNAFFYIRINGDFLGSSKNPRSDKRRTMQQYIDLFKDAGDAIAIGESSFYLYSDTARKTIHELTPNAKFILIFRNPVDRAYSNFLYLRQYGEEPSKDFRRALTQEEKRRANGTDIFWWYKANGLYAKHLKKYLEIFRRDQFYFLLYDDWKANNQKYLQEIFKFLGVDETILIQTNVKYNVGGTHRMPSIGNFLFASSKLKTFLEKFFNPVFPKSIRSKFWSFFTKLNTKPAPNIDPALREELIDFYRQDILDLQDLIKMDLSHWLVS